ncbi:MAG: GTP-binding protein [Haliangiales bacterium]
MLLLSGFLGSGKTTLLNRLMRQLPAVLDRDAQVDAGRLAIIVNEFGEVGIDGDLLPTEMTRQVELPGGCICCVLNEDLDKTLIELLDSSPDISMIVIETTGIAEPMPICWSLERAPLSERVRLAAVVTVVDAAHFEASRSLSPGVDAQVEYADILVVGKLDLLELDAPPEALLGTLAELNPDAPVMAGSPEQVVDLLWRSILDPTAPRQRQQPHATNMEEPTPEHAGHEHAGHEHAGHEHTLLASPHGFETLWLPIESHIDFEELADQLDELPSNWVRIKGIACAIDRSTGSSEPRWLAFHRVGSRVSCEPIAGPADARVVALGMRLDRDRLAACLAASVIPSTGVERT